MSTGWSIWPRWNSTRASRAISSFRRSFTSARFSVSIPCSASEVGSSSRTSAIWSSDNPSSRSTMIRWMRGSCSRV